MPTDLQIHRLTSSDVALLRRLNELFADAFEDAESYLHAPPDDAYCRRTLGHAHVIALVALRGTAMLGGLVAYELPKLERRRSEIYLYDLAVAAPHRRQGVATRLIEVLRGIAEARGAWVVFVQADHGDDPAIALYGKLGTREDVLHFDLPVP